MIGSVNVPGASVADMAVINNTLSNKVDKETGKGLSSNDYTTEDKQKLASLENYDDSTLLIAIANKVDKIDGKGLSTEDYTTEEKTKLANIDLNDDTSQDIEDIKHLLYPSITAAGVQGIPVTFTKGDRVLSQIPDESYAATEYIPELGTWTVATTINGVEISKDLDVADVMKKYSVQTGFTKTTAVKNLSTRDVYVVGTSVGNYALFGGYYSSTVIDVYNSKLIKSNNLSSSNVMYEAAATSVGDYALFAGGTEHSSGSTISHSEVNAYNSSLVKATAPNLSAARDAMGATSVGDYALFAGGKSYRSTGSTSQYYSAVDAYNSSLVRSSLDGLYFSNIYSTATTVGDYALFGGGLDGANNSVKNVYAYNSSLVKFTASNLTNYKNSHISAATAGNYALFANNYYANENHIDAYNSSLVQSSAPALSVARDGLGSVSIGDCALFGGGMCSNSNSTKAATVDKYNISLVMTAMTPLSAGRYNIAGTSVGNYALFAGGYSSDVVDAYEINYV